MSGNEHPGRVVGVGRRAVAAFIDGWVVVGPMYLLAWLLGTTRNDFAVLQAVTITTAVLVYEVGATARWGMTIGKRAVGIRVVGADGQPPSVIDAARRYVVKSLFPLVLLLALVGVATSGIGLIWDIVIVVVVVGRSDRRGPHDLAAGTWVVAMSDQPLARILARNVPPVPIVDNSRFTGRKRRYTPRR